MVVFAQQETHLIGFSFQNHTAEITEVPIVMLRAHKGEGESILYGDLFANYSIFCVDTVCAKRGEHLKSHMKNSYDCYHGVWFCGVLTEWVHLIGFSRHPSAQQEKKKNMQGENIRRGEIGSKKLRCVCQDTLRLICTDFPPSFTGYEVFYEPSLNSN